MSPRRASVCIHTPDEIRGIRRAAQAAAAVRDQLAAAIQPGMSTADVDRLAARLIGETGGEPAFFNYRGFPGTICISLNDEVVHGIGVPGRIIQPGDLVSLDVGVRLDGFIGDTATSVCAGGVANPEAAKLMNNAQECLVKAIAVARGGNHVADIGGTVEKHARTAGFAVVRDFVGHGCGCELHEPPEVPNFKTSHRGPRLEPGMVLAIEPMVNAGTARVSIDNDGWTVRTADGRLSAHFEHMVLITQKEAEILTWPKM